MMRSLLVALCFTLTPSIVSANPTILVSHISSKPTTLPDRDLHEAILFTAVKRASPALSVMSMADVERQLEHEATRQRMGCNTEACLAEIAGSTGADETVFAKVMRSGKAPSPTSPA